MEDSAESGGGRGFGETKARGESLRHRQAPHRLTKTCPSKIHGHEFHILPTKPPSAWNGLVFPGNSTCKTTSFLSVTSDWKIFLQIRHAIPRRSPRGFCFFQKPRAGRRLGVCETLGSVLFARLDVDVWACCGRVFRLPHLLLPVRCKILL